MRLCAGQAAGCGAASGPSPASSGFCLRTAAHWPVPVLTVKGLPGAPGLLAGGDWALLPPRLLVAVLQTVSLPVHSVREKPLPCGVEVFVEPLEPSLKGTAVPLFPRSLTLFFLPRLPSPAGGRSVTVGASSPSFRAPKVPVCVPKPSQGFCVIRTIPAFTPAPLSSSRWSMQGTLWRSAETAVDSPQLAPVPHVWSAGVSATVRGTASFLSVLTPSSAEASPFLPGHPPAVLGLCRGGLVTRIQQRIQQQFSNQLFLVLFLSG